MCIFLGRGNRIEAGMRQGKTVWSEMVQSSAVGRTICVARKGKSHAPFENEDG